MKKKLMRSMLVIAAITPPSAVFSKTEQVQAKRGSSKRPSHINDKDKQLSPVKEKVTQIIIDEFGVKEAELFPGTHFKNDLKADWLDYLVLLVRIEEEFGVKISDDDALLLVSVQDACDYIEARMAERQATIARPKFNLSRVRPKTGKSVSYEAFHIDERKIEDIVILDLKGDFVIDHSSILLRETMGRLLNERSRKFIINLAHLNFSDSRGIKAMISNMKIIDRVRGKVKLLNPKGDVKEVLKSIRPEDNFEVYEDETKAIESFKSQVDNMSSRNAEKKYRTRREVEEKIREILVEQLTIEPKLVIPAALIKSDLGADSLDEVEIILRLEEEFGIDIPDEEAEKMDRVSRLNKYIWLRIRPESK